MNLNVKIQVVLENENCPVEKGHGAHVAEIMEKHINNAYKELGEYIETNNDSILLGNEGFVINHQP
jgi:hypothetical protein